MVVPWEVRLQEAKREAYHRAVDDFLDSDMTTNASIDSGLKFHQQRIPITSPSGLLPCPEAELDRRLAIAKEIQNHIREDSFTVADAWKDKLGSFQLNVMQLALLLASPDIDRMDTLTTTLTPRWMYEGIQATEGLLASFLQRADSQPARVSGPGTPRSSRETTQESTLGKRRRGSSDHKDGDGDDGDDGDDGGDNIYQPLVSSGSSSRALGERNKALQRDNFRCVVTHSVYPDVCHIWPFSANKNATNRDHTRDVLNTALRVLKPQLQRQIKGLLAPSSGELASSDKAWNMLSMAPHLHRFWGKALFGLKWAGVGQTDESTGYTAFFVEWHWLPEAIPKSIEKHLSPRRGLDAKRLVDLDSEDSITAISQALKASFRQTRDASSFGAEARDGCGRLLESRQTLTLRVKTEDIDKIKAVIEAQWLAVQIAALSGAAEAPEQLNRKPPDNPPGFEVFELRPRDEEWPSVESPPQAESQDEEPLTGSMGRGQG